MAGFLQMILIYKCLFPFSATQVVRQDLRVISTATEKLVSLIS